MTIFLTTQYLEEADALADRVGFIAAGRLVAEGAPDELKSSIGHDVIVAEVDGGRIRGDRGRSCRCRRQAIECRMETDGRSTRQHVGRSGGVEPGGGGTRTAGLEVKSLTLRTPTLDDVFMELTGSRDRGSA